MGKQEYNTIQTKKLLTVFLLTGTMLTHLMSRKHTSVLGFHTGTDLDPVADSQRSVLLTKNQKIAKGVCGKTPRARSGTIPEKVQGPCRDKKVKARREYFREDHQRLRGAENLAFLPLPRTSQYAWRKRQQPKQSECANQEFSDMPHRAKWSQSTTYTLFFK